MSPSPVPAIAKTTSCLPFVVRRNTGRKLLYPPLTVEMHPEARLASASLASSNDNPLQRSKVFYQ